MPRIPDASQLGYSVPQTRTTRFQNRSGQIVGDATQRLAGTIGQVAGALQEREDKFSYAQAKSTLLQADIEARRSLENDGDWATYEKRYAEKMAKARETATGFIRGNRDRALFDMDAKLDVERGVGEIRGLSKRKEIDWGRGALDATLEANRTAALNAKDEQTRAALISATKEIIGGAKAKGYVSEQEAVNHQQVWTANYAEAYVGMQPAADRISLLAKPKGTVADYIAPDRRAAIAEAAKRENRDLTVRRESQAQEDAIVAKYGTSTSALKAAREIEDPEVRDSTMSRIKSRQAEAKTAEIEHQNSLSEQAIDFMNGGGKFADLPLAIKSGLKPSALKALREDAERTGARRTNPEALIELSRLSTDDPQGFGEMNMLDYKARLSDQDFEEFVDLQRKIRTGSMDGKATGFMTLNQVRDDRLRDLFGSAMPTAKEGGQVSAARRKFVEQYETQLRSVKQQTGKAPATDDARKILDDLTAEVAINWGSDKRVFELTDEDISAVPAAHRDAIIRQLQRQGKPITQDAIVSWYQKVAGGAK